MKNILLIVLLIPFSLIAQIQLGQDIDGESQGDLSGRGLSISSDGSIVAIGAPANNDNGDFSGHVRIFKNINNEWTQVGQDIDGEIEGDGTGYNVALSSDGSIIAVTSNIDNSLKGRVRVFENINNQWVQIGDNIDGVAEGDRFGSALSISDDGSIIAVGAAFHNGPNGDDSGLVQVFENNNGTWTQIGQNLYGEGQGDLTGLDASVSLSSNGTILAIGSKFYDGPNGTDSGLVRVFENINGSWTQIGQDINGSSSFDFFGRILKLSSDGTILAISAIGAQGSNGESLAGEVRVFENINGSWTQIGQNITGEAEQDFSGRSISLSSLGNIIAIGAPENDGNGINSGHVRIYKNINNNWVQIGDDINGEAASDNSGSGVVLSADGSILAIGATINDGNGVNSGHVRVFDLSGVLSTEEFSNTRFSLFPNPASNTVTISLTNGTILNKAVIYNSLGQVVLESTKTIIDISSLSTGSYFMEIDTDRGIGNKKLLIE